MTSFARVVNLEATFIYEAAQVIGFKQGEKMMSTIGRRVD